MLRNLLNNVLKKKLYLFITIFVILIVGISLGSAILTKTLNIVGKTKIENNWIIYFDNVVLNNDSVKNDDISNDAKIVDFEKQNIEFNANLSSINDFYEFDVYTVNDGNVDAMIDSIELTGLSGNEEYITYDVRYDDGSIQSSDTYYSNKYEYSNNELKPCDPLYARTRRKIKVRVSLKKELEGDEPINLHLGFKINYVQYDDTCALKHTLTIDPNGGTYNGRVSNTKLRIVSGSTELIKVPKKGDQEFLGWEATPSSGTYTFDPTQTSEQQFTMGDEDVTLKAKWSDEGDFVARIENTYYTTIQSAFNDVDTGWTDNTVHLLRSTTEYPTNNANTSFKFDLEGYTVTGMITNSKDSNITLINGRIVADTNDKQAITNNGILSLGLNDGTVEVENSISLKGNDKGIVNSKGSTFNFYDGYIDVAISQGGVGATITGLGNVTTPENYSIVVDSIENGQRAYVTRDPSRKVAKTTTGGAIFYANLQDAFNAAMVAKRNLYDEQKNKAMAEQGESFDEAAFKISYMENFEDIAGTSYENFYKVYAIRDFDTPYQISVPTNNDVYFDTAGFDIQFGDTVTNNGGLYVSNSVQYFDVDDRSKFTLAKTITNNGKLTIEDINMDATTDINLIANNNYLEIDDSNLTARVGYVIYNVLNGTIKLGENAVIKSSDQYGLYNSSNSELVLDNGTVYGLENHSSLKLTGNIKLLTHRNTAGNDSYYCLKNYDNVEISGGKIKSDISTVPIYNTKNIKYTGGDIESSNTLISNNYAGKFEMLDGTISSDNTIVSGGTTIIHDNNNIKLISNGITIMSSNVTLNGGEVISNESTAIYDGNVTMNSGKVKAKDIGINLAYEQNVAYIYGGTIVSDNIGIEAWYSTYRYFRGSRIYMYGGEVIAKNIGLRGSYVTEMTGGKIIAHDPDNEESSSIGILAEFEFSVPKITGGEVYGDLYGIKNNGTLTLGTNDDNISGDTPVIVGDTYGLYSTDSAKTNFYDGILKGITDGYYGIITELPFGAVVGEDTETINEKLYNTDFVEGYDNWLRVGDEEFNNINAASRAIENEGTMVVIKDASISFPQEIFNNESNNKKITLDLNGYTLQTNQTITNNVELTVTDSSQNKTGKYEAYSNNGIYNKANCKMTIDGGTYVSNIDKPIYNRGELIVENATFNVEKNGIYNETGAILTINNIDITNSSTGIYNSGTFTMNNGTIHSNEQCINSYNGTLLTVNDGSLYSNKVVISSNSGDIIINNGYFESTTTGNAINNEYGKITINDGEIISRNGVGLFSKKNVEVNNGKITGTEGIRGEGDNINFNIKGGEITGTTKNGIFTNKGYLYVSGGKIIGNQNGIYATNYVEIGTEGGELSITSPVIQGKQYGLVNNTYTKFFDGILKGIQGGHSGLITMIEDGTMIKDDIDFIDGSTYKTEYLVEFGNWIRVGNQEFNSINDAVNATPNGGTMVVIANPYIGFKQAIPTGRDVKLDLNGHSLIMTEPLTNFGSLNIIDSTASGDNLGGSISNLDNSAIINNGYLTIDAGYYSSEHQLTNRDKVYTIYNTEDGDLTFNNGSIITVEEYSVYNLGKYTMNGGKIDTIKGIYTSGTFEMNGGLINTTRDEGLYTAGTTTINGGTIQRTERANGGKIYSVLVFKGDTTITGGNIISNFNSGNGINISDTNRFGTKLTINGGHIYGKYYGISVDSNYSPQEGCLIINDGLIESDNSGINLSKGIVQINGGQVKGYLNGIDISGGKLVLGANDGNILINTPEIIGDTYAVNNYSNGTFDFYDGILVGNSNGDVDTYFGDITTIPDESELFYGLKEIDGVTYTTTYLTPETEKAINVQTNVRYTNFQQALDEAEEGQTVKLLTDFSVFYEANNTNTNSFTLDMNGHKIITNKTIKNNGDLSIINSSDNDGIIQTRSKIELINNNSKLSMNNIKINYLSDSSDKTVIVNSDELALDNVTIMTKRPIVYSTGKLTIDNSKLKIVDYTRDYNGFYAVNFNSANELRINNSEIDQIRIASNSENYINDSIINGELYKINAGLTKVDSTIINGWISINRGKVNLTDSTLNFKRDVNDKSATGVRLDNTDTTFNMVNSKINMYDENNLKNYLYGINGIGTVNISQGSEINVGRYDSNQVYNSGYYGINVKNGNVIMTDSKIKVSGSGTGYGIYIDNANSTVTMPNGEITVEKAQNSYGVYANKGSFIYGENDNVVYSEKDRYEDPKIKATGFASGIGIKRVNGSVSYYDGIIWSSSHTIPEIPTSIAYPYEVTTYVDETNGYKYAVLEDINNDYKGTAVALCNGIYYTRLQDAINSANEGDEVKLLQSITEDILVDKYEDVIINLNGKSVTTTIDNKGKLRVYNGVLENVDNNVVRNTGTFIMGTNDGNVSSTNMKIASEVTAFVNNGTLIMYDGFIEGNDPIDGVIDEIAPLSRIYTYEDVQKTKKYIQSISEQSILDGQTDLILYINPNGGTYDGSSEVKEVYLKHNGTYILNTPSNDNAIFDGWTSNVEDVLVDNVVTMNLSDVTVTANWIPNGNVVAAIGKKYYTSLSSALADSKNGDVIELIKNTTENVVVDKNITIDLNSKKLSGSITNNSTLTLINGIVENTSGTAITNNGTLILGENDNSVDNNSIKVIGNDKGIKQNGVLYYYDGTIEGIEAIDGNVDSIANGYYLNIASNNGKQVVTLETNPENAIAAINNGNTLYFTKLSDAIAAAETYNKEIIIIKDFESVEQVTVNENTNISINLNGHNIILGNSITNNGNLIIRDSINNSGTINNVKTLENNGSLNLKNITINQMTANKTILNNGSMVVDNSKITSKNSEAIETSGSMNVINNSIVTSENTYGILNKQTDALVISSGTISGINNDGNLKLENGAKIIVTLNNLPAIYSKVNSTLVMDGGVIESNYYGIQLQPHSTANSINTTINGGTITAVKDALYSADVNNNNILITGGKLESTTSNGITYSRYDSNSLMTMTGGEIIGTNYGVYVYGRNNNFKMTGGIIHNTSQSVAALYCTSSANCEISGDARIIADSYNALQASGNLTLNGGYVESKHVSGACIYFDGPTLKISGDTKLVARGTNSYGLYIPSQNKNIIIDDVDIYSNNIGIDILGDKNTLTIKNGNVVGRTYGINATNSNTVNIGDPEVADVSQSNPYITGGLYGLYTEKTVDTNFYSGRLRGLVYGYNQDFSSVTKNKAITSETEIDLEHNSTNTSSTDQFSRNPATDTAKADNGYAMITYIGTDESCPSTPYEYDYSGMEIKFTTPCTGKYKLEVWGAQGGSYGTGQGEQGGYGGYSTGEINLTQNEILYINVGGKGSTTLREANSRTKGGYNGGGEAMNSTTDGSFGGSGGGATSITTSSGLLSKFENNREAIIIVAGGGGGYYYSNVYDNRTRNVGHGGGFEGKISNNGKVIATGGTQTDGYAFGTASQEGQNDMPGAGGGYYGGYSNKYTAGGGSGYIGNSRLSNAHMYGYKVFTTTGQWINNYLVNKDDFLQVGANTYNSFIDAIEAAGTNGTILVIADSSVNEKGIVAADTNITLDLNGHNLVFSESITNNGSLTIKDSLNSNKYIKNTVKDAINNYGDLNIQNVILKSKGNAIKIASHNHTISLDNATIETDGDSIVIANNNSYSNTITINNSSLTSNNGIALSIRADNSNKNIVTVNNSEISGIKTAISIKWADLNLTNSQVTANTVDNYMIILDTTKTNIADCTITSDTSNGISTSAATVNIDNSQILLNRDISSNPYGAYGIYNGYNSYITLDQNTKLETNGLAIYYYHAGNLTINDAEIISNKNIGIQLNSDNSNLYVNGGKIVGKRYGIYLSWGNVNIGSSEKELSIESPYISGDEYAIYKKNGTVNFYNGKIRGITGTYNGEFNKLRTGMRIYESFEFGIPGDMSTKYTVNYLGIKEGFLQVGENTYNTFEDAIEALGEGKTGTIKLLSNTVLQEEVTFDCNDVVFDLNGYKITTALTMTNSGKLTIIDSTNNEGSIINTVGNAINNSGELIINSGTIRAKANGVYSNTSNSTLIVNGGLINATGIAVNYNTNGLKDSYVKITGGKIQSTGSYGMRLSTNSNLASNNKLDITGGEIIGNDYGIYINSFIVNISNAYIESNTNSAIYFSGSEFDFNVSNTRIYSKNGTGISYYGKLSIENCNITVDGTNSSGIDSIGGTTDYNSGNKIISKGNGIITTSNFSTININGGEIEAQGSGVYTNSMRSTINVYGGSIKGNNYGIYANNSTTVNMGNIDVNVSNSVPYVQGDLYGLYNNSNATFNMYNGILKGISGAFNSKVDGVRDRYKIKIELLSDNYTAAYLVEATKDIKNMTTGEDYYTLKDAIEDVNEDDELKLMDDVDNYETITIAQDKKFTIDLNGHNIKTSKAITNNGDISIINSSSNPSEFATDNQIQLFTNNNKIYSNKVNYKGYNMFKNNNSTSSININNSIINASNNTFENSGLVTLDNVELTSNSHAFYDYTSSQNNIITNSKVTITGNANVVNKNSSSKYTFTNTDITGGTIGIHGNGSEVTINGGELNNVYYYNAAQLTINDAIIKYEKENWNGEYVFQNVGTLYLNRNTITHIQNVSNNNEEIIVLNDGTVESSGNTYVSYNNDDSVRIRRFRGIYNKKIVNSSNDTFNIRNGNEGIGIYTEGSNTVTINNITTNINNCNTAYGIYSNTSSTININGSNINTSNSTSSYGIYVNNGTITLETGNINSSGETAYGVKLVAGTFTLGLNDSNVSIEQPHISSVGSTSGYGISLENSALINFYDGYIIGSTGPKDNATFINDRPTGYVEHTKFDNQTGYNYMILEQE